MEDEQSCPNEFEELARLGEEVDSIPDESTVISLKKVKRAQPPKKRIQYATRGMRHSYCEAEVPDDDHYICKLNYSIWSVLLMVYNLK